MTEAEALQRTPAPWRPEDHPATVAILGKLIEELGEAAQAAARCLIQGRYEADPTTGQMNLSALECELADVAAMVSLLTDLGHLSRSAMGQRTRAKAKFTGEWLEGLGKLSNGGATRCLGCQKILREGDPYYPDVSGEALHAACLGAEREGFVDLESGEPLAEGEPIPAPSIWSEG